VHSGTKARAFEELKARIVHETGAEELVHNRSVSMEAHRRRTVRCLMFETGASWLWKIASH